MQKGFTLVELLLVMGIMMILTSIIMVSVLRPQTQASLEAAADILVSDLRTQQLKAMARDTSGDDASDAYGIYFQANQYTLFEGGIYSIDNPSNHVVLVEEPVSLTTNLVGSQIIFDVLSGEAASVASGANQVVITSSVSNQSKTITLNNYGVIIGYQ